MASSYDGLAEYLRSRQADVWDAAFHEVEEKLGRPLPRSAYRHQAWWANQTGPGHSQTQGWRSAGWRTAKLDLERQRVRFEREQDQGRRPEPALADEQIDEALVDRALLVGDLVGRGRVINAALREYVRNEAKRQVIAMGGTQPDFRPTPRERPGA